MSAIGKEFGWTGPGKYVTKNGDVFTVFETGDSQWPFIGLLEGDGGWTASWRLNGSITITPDKNDLIAPYVPPREKLRGWLNNYGGYYTLHKSKKEAEELADENRIACVYVKEATPPKDGK